MRWLVLASLLLPSAARADHRADLAAAGRLLLDGRHQEAIALVAPLAPAEGLLPAERAEAHRIHGLALFHLGRRAEAERALRAYLALEPDAHLDPALHPPEAVVFLEEIRTRHAGELRRARPPPRRRRYPALNFLPPLGQIQNGDRGKAWVLGGLELALLATNVSTYAMLKSSCRDDLTCERDASSARRMRTLNLVSGGLLAGVWLYGVIDGYVGHSRAVSRERALRMAIVPTGSGALVGASMQF
jgi:hypothetical protein